MNEIPWMMFIEKSNFRLTAHEILNKCDKHIKPLFPFINMAKVKWFRAAKIDRFIAGFTIIIQFSQILLRKATMI